MWERRGEKNRHKKDKLNKLGQPARMKRNTNTGQPKEIGIRQAKKKLKPKGESPKGEALAAYEQRRRRTILRGGGKSPVNTTKKK